MLFVGKKNSFLSCQLGISFDKWMTSSRMVVWICQPFSNNVFAHEMIKKSQWITSRELFEKMAHKIRRGILKIDIEDELCGDHEFSLQDDCRIDIAKICNGFDLHIQVKHVDKKFSLVCCKKNSFGSCSCCSGVGTRMGGRFNIMPAHFAAIFA